MLSTRRLLFICGAVLLWAYSAGNKRFDYQYAESPPESFNSDFCAKLNYGEICTFAGNPDLGNKIDPTLLRQNLKFGPSAHTNDTTGFFIADRAHNVIWYWNRSSQAVTRLGVAIDARKIRIVAGSGSSISPATTMALQTQFNGISSLAYEAAKDTLYVAESTNHRVRFIDQGGLVHSGLGGIIGPNGSDLAIHQSCQNPTSIALSSNRDYLYISCQGDRAIKAWDLGAKTAVTLIDMEAPASLTVINKRVFVVAPSQNKILEIIRGHAREFYQHNHPTEKLSTLAAGVKNLWVTTSEDRLIAIDFGQHTSHHYGHLKASALTVDLQNPKRLIFSQEQGRFGFFDTESQAITQSIGSGEFRFGFIGDQSLPRNQQKLNFVTGLALDKKSNELMVMDSGNCRVRRVVDGAMETAVAKGCGSPTIENQNPLNSFLDTFSAKNGISLAGLSFLPDQSLLIANTGANSIRLWNRGPTEESAAGPIERNKLKTFAGDFLSRGYGLDGEKAIESRLNRPSYAIQDPLSKKILIADSANGCIKKLNSDGTLSTIFGRCGTKGVVTTNTTHPLFTMPTSLAFDSFGNLLVADRGSSSVVFINRTTKPINAAGLSIPAGHASRIACSENGDMSEGILAIHAECAAPTGVAIHENKVCFSNQLSHNVRCFDLYGPRAGKIVTVAGQAQVVARAGSPFGLEQEGIAGIQATLALPSALAFDAKGDLYIADTYNHLVRKVKLSK